MVYQIIFSGAASAIITVIAMIAINKINDKKYIRSNLDNQLKEILKISIEYPYLESKKFTDGWLERKKNEDDEVLRYDLYCTLLFNYLAKLSSFYKYKVHRVEAHVDIKPWVRLHKNYWQHPLSEFDNVDGYKPEFQKLINSFLEK